MKKRLVLIAVFTVSLLLILPFGLIRAERSVSAATSINVSTDVWPTWPNPNGRINGMEVWEPATFLSIGRDVISWVYFGTRPSDDGFVSADVYYLVKKSATDGSIHTFEPDIAATDALFIVPGASAIQSPTNSEILTGLRGSSGAPAAVFPEYRDIWLSNNAVGYPNEHFRDNQAWLDLDDWRNFLRGTYSASFKYADTGHAPPQIVWDVDPWLEAFLVNQYTPPSAWVDRVVGIVSTNQGTLQGFEIYPEETAPRAERKWVTVPNPVFRQSIFHSLRKMYAGVFKRLTLMDGPFTVRDVEIDGTWKRILVGTTGLGTPQSVKPQDAWDTLAQAPGLIPQPMPTMEESGRGRIFGVYAYDITQLATTPYASTLKPSWSTTKVNFTHSGRNFSGFYPVNSSNTTDSYNGYSDIKFSVSKPLIGYTAASSARTWHTILLGVDANNLYRWIDANPKDGKNLQNALGAGVFTRPVKLDDNNKIIVASQDEMLTAISDNGTILSAEQVETLYPSRILAAFPPPDYPLQKPLLSSIYVYLSNGSLYRWNLNDGEAPKWIATFQNKKGLPLAPLTDFDISYLNGKTYLAATVAFTYNGASAHQTSGLMSVDLTAVESMDVTDRVFQRDPVAGQEGDIVSSPKNDPIMLVQLQGAKGAYTTGTKEVMASPVFIKEKLYLAYYELTTSKKINLSRLYVIPFASMIGSGNIQKLTDIPGALYELEEQRVVNMFVDSKGNLVLIGEEGETLLSLPTGLEYAGVGSGSAASTFNKMSVVYWKKL